MAVDLIPDDMRQFIADRIDSVAELEGLLLLRNNPETEWNVKKLAEALYAAPEQAENVLARLYSQGFLTIREGELPAYRYQPNSPELAETVDRVAEAYSKYLIPVTNLIHSKPQIRIQQFADAFKLRKKEDK